jgi:hypothetical protein
MFELLYIFVLCHVLKIVAGKIVGISYLSLIEILNSLAKTPATLAELPAKDPVQKMIT